MTDSQNLYFQNEQNTPWSQVTSTYKLCNCDNKQVEVPNHAHSYCQTSLLKVISYLSWITCPAVNRDEMCLYFKYYPFTLVTLPLSGNKAGGPWCPDGQSFVLLLF